MDKDYAENQPHHIILTFDSTTLKQSFYQEIILWSGGCQIGPVARQLR